jgi:hypothetical protein
MESSRWWRPLAIASSTAEDVAAAVESLGPAYKGYARKVIEQAIDGPCIHQLFEESREFRAEDPRYLDRLIEDALGVSSRIHRLKILVLFRNIYDQERAVRDFHMRLDVFRNNMHPLLAASSALVVFGRCRVPAHGMQRPALLGTMLSQRLTARVSLHGKLRLGKERLQLLCCGCPLSALLLRLATVVDRSGRTSIEYTYVVCIMKRYLSGVARRLWSKCMQ